MPCMMSVLVQQCSSTSNPAERMIRAAVLNSRFKYSSGGCVEIEGVMEISEKNRNSERYRSMKYLLMLRGAECLLALVALMIRVSFNKQLLYCRELFLTKLVARGLARLFREVTPMARTFNERCVGLDFWSVYPDDHT